MPNRRSEQLLGASSELTAGSGLLGPHRRVVTLIDRNGESMLTPDLVAVLSESAHNQPLSDLSILTKLLLEQLRGQVTMHGHSATALGALSVHLARHVWSRVQQNGYDIDYGGMDGHRIPRMKIGDGILEAAQLCCDVCHALAIPVASLVERPPGCDDKDIPPTGAHNAAATDKDSRVKAKVFSSEDERQKDSLFDDEFGWFFNDDPTEKNSSPPSTDCTAREYSQPLESTKTDAKNVESNSKNTPDAEGSIEYRKRLLWKLCEGLQHRVPAEWELLESLDCSSRNDSAFSSNFSSLATDSSSCPSSFALFSSSSSSLVLPARLAMEAVLAVMPSQRRPLKKTAEDDLLYFIPRIGKGKDFEFVGQTAIGEDLEYFDVDCAPLDDKDGKAYSEVCEDIYQYFEESEEEESEEEDFEEDSDAFDYCLEDMIEYLALDAEELEQRDGGNKLPPLPWYRPNLRRIIVHRSVGPNPAHSQLLRHSSVLVPVPPPAESQLRDTLRERGVKTRGCDDVDWVIGLVIGDCDEGQFGEGSGVSQATFDAFDETTFAFSAADFTRSESEASSYSRPQGLSVLEAERELWRRYAIEALRCAGVSLLVVTGAVSKALVYACAQPASAAATSRRSPNYYAGPIAILPYCPMKTLNALSMATRATPVHDILDMRRSLTSKPKVNLESKKNKSIHVRFIDSYDASSSFAGWTADGEGIYLVPEKLGDVSPATTSPNVYLLVTVLPSSTPCGPDQVSTQPSSSSSTAKVVSIVLCGPTPGVVEEMVYAFWRTAYRLQSALSDGAPKGLQSNANESEATSADPPGKVLVGGGFVELVCAQTLRWYGTHLAAIVASTLEAVERHKTGQHGKNKKDGEADGEDHQDSIHTESVDCLVARSEAMATFADALEHGFILHGLCNRGLTVQQSLKRLDICRNALFQYSDSDSDTAGEGIKYGVGEIKAYYEAGENGSSLSKTVYRRLDAIHEAYKGSALSSVKASAPFIDVAPSIDEGEDLVADTSALWDCLEAKAESFGRAATFIDRALAVDQIFWAKPPA